MSAPVVGKVEALTADARQDREIVALRKEVRALTDRVAQLERQLGPDAGLENPRRARAR